MRHRLLWAFGFSFEKKNGFVCFCCCSFFRECRARFHWTTFFFWLNRNWISGTEFYRVSTRFDRLLLGAVLGFTGCLPSCTGFLIDLLGQKKSSPPYLFLSSRGLLGFYSMLPDGFTIFIWLYWVLLSFTEFLLSFFTVYNKRKKLFRKRNREQLNRIFSRILVCFVLFGLCHPLRFTV